LPRSLRPAISVRYISPIRRARLRPPFTAATRISVIWLASMKNVYLDSSEIETLVYPSELKNVLKFWLETYAEKITFGSDA
jgi:predicted TIM-barrel fold metal-dependent hydrolase